MAVVLDSCCSILAAFPEAWVGKLPWRRPTTDVVLHMVMATLVFHFRHFPDMHFFLIHWLDFSSVLAGHLPWYYFLCA